MKNLKFGVFCLGLLLATGVAVSSLNAQDRQRPSTRERRPMADVFSLMSGGSQLGVMASDTDAKSTTGGAKIDDVHAGSPAEKAGIKAGDVVVEFDGERVRSARHFTRLVQETPDGRAVKVTVLRNGQRQTLEATPEERTNFTFDFEDRVPRRFEYRLPDGYREFRFPAPGSRFPSASRGRLGVSVQSITPELADYFGATNGGALVSSVRRDSAASKAGLKAGDVIVSVNGRSVRDADDLIDELDDITPSTSLGAGGEATIVVLRDKKQVTMKADLR